MDMDMYKYADTYREAQVAAKMDAMGGNGKEVTLGQRPGVPCPTQGAIGAAHRCGDQNMASEPPTLRGLHEERVSYHRLQAENADQAAAFFRENPAFDMFVRLVRSGVIQF